MLYFQSGYLGKAEYCIYHTVQLAPVCYSFGLRLTAEDWYTNANDFEFLFRKSNCKKTRQSTPSSRRPLKGKTSLSKQISTFRFSGQSIIANSTFRNSLAAVSQTVSRVLQQSVLNIRRFQLQRNFVVFSGYHRQRNRKEKQLNGYV